MNMQKPVENLVFDFLTAAIESAPADSILHNLELHDTIYQTINEDLGVRIGDAESDLSPLGDGTFKEFDAYLQLVCYSRIRDDDKTQRLASRNRVFDLAGEITKLFFDDSSMNGSVCDVMVLTNARGFDNIKGESFAVANVPLVINRSGAINFTRRS